MRITRCTPDDLDDLVWIARKTFRETFAGQNTAKDMAAYLASAFSPEKLAAELRCPDSALFLARELGAPVGYLQLNRGRAQTEHPLENAAEIQRIYVLSGAKGRGVGSQLMRLARKPRANGAAACSGWASGNTTCPRSAFTAATALSASRSTSFSWAAMRRPIFC